MSQPAPASPERCWLTPLLALALAALAFAVFAPALRFDFVDYDDPLYVTQNEWVKTGLTAASIQKAWREPVAGNWHPVTMLSHLLDVTLYGLDPAGHHRTSLLLHALNTALLFLLLRGLFGGWWRPALAAALFAVHPANTDSAVWIAERKNVLSTACWLGTTLLYLRHVRRPSPALLLGAAACFQMGLMSKPMLVTLPFTLLLLDVWPLRRAPGFTRVDLQAWRRLLDEKSAFFILALISCIVTLATQFDGPFGHGPDVPPLAARAAFALEHYRLYLATFLLPTGLCALYPRLPMPPDPAMILRAALVLAAVSAGAIATRRRVPALLFGWCWFLGTLFPLVGLVSIGFHSIADRYLYVPMIGLLIALFWGLPEAWLRRRAVALPGLALALAAIVGAAGITRATLHHWRDSEALFRRAIAVTRDNAVMQYNLGRLLTLQGQREQARDAFREAIRIQPGYHEAQNNLGWALALDGHHTEALPHYEESLRIEPRNRQARLNLARSLTALGRHAEARHHLEEAGEAGWMP